MSTGEPDSPGAFDDAPTLLDPPSATKEAVRRATVRPPAPAPLPLEDARGRMGSGVDLIEGRFRSLFVIGRGGMGTIEVALEQGTGGYERIVALKRMLPEASIEKHQVDMFLREARLAVLLAHPNVVHAFSFGEHKGQLFLAMEYVEGEPLSHVLTAMHLKEGRVAPPLIAHILADICEGLHAAHELRDETFAPLNLVHRDVSPHNVMIAYEGHVKLLDFGVAKIDQLDPRGGRTKTGEIKGKTAYMSPEQAMGERLDRRSDLYSIGVVLFECIAGKRMWGNGTDLETLRKLALEEPPSLAEAAPGAPPALCSLHQRLVARDPLARPPTARAVGEELRRFIAETGTRPDARVVRAVMNRLFESEIAQRRAALSAALNDAAPDDAEELRKSLAPTGFSKTEIAVPNFRSEPPRVLVHDPERAEPTVPHVLRRARRSRFFAWALLGTAIGILGGAAVIRWESARETQDVAANQEAPPQAATSGAPTTVTATREVPGTLPAPTTAVPATGAPLRNTTPPTSTTSTTSNGTLRAPTSATSAPVRPPAQSKTKKVAPQPAGAPTKPVTDVDPTPF
jgi:serine/threonine protein kinase